MRLWRFFVKRYSMEQNKARLFGGITPIYWALIILLCPISWIIPMVIAALIHELGHFWAIRWCGKKIKNMKVGITGAILVAGNLSPGQELFCALAGPVAGLLTLLLRRWFPRLALFALLQSVFNLLPIYPLDGGRIISCVATVLHIPQLLCKILSGILLTAILILSVYGTFILHLGLSPIFIAVMLLYRAVTAKRPCKASLHPI